MKYNAKFCQFEESWHKGSFPGTSGIVKICQNVVIIPCI